MIKLAGVLVAEVVAVVVLLIERVDVQIALIGGAGVVVASLIAYAGGRSRRRADDLETYRKRIEDLEAWRDGDLKKLDAQEARISELLDTIVDIKEKHQSTAQEMLRASRQQVDEERDRLNKAHYEDAAWLWDRIKLLERIIREAGLPLPNSGEAEAPAGSRMSDE